MTDQVALDIQDDGRGFDPRDLDTSFEGGGFGLKTMQQRAEQSGGNVLIESANGKGTTLVVQIPINEVDN
jgi:signal transduction histidine kinase